LNYKAEGTGKDKMLSDGQKLMLSAGLAKLQILEDSFVKLGTTKYPKMMVVCEDTSITSVVEQYLRDKGLQEEDILCIDSNKQGEVGEKQWLEIKERLFNVDKYSSPKVIISVLMLREGFDVNNICVIVPLRASESHILLEQIIGRGLRLMFREKEYEEEKIENRNRIYNKQKPNSYIDMLSIIEHPRFIDFYKDLLDDNPATVETDDSALSSPCSDMISVKLKEDYKKYDMFFPVIIKDKEETITPKDIDINKLQPFNTFTLEQLQNILARNKGEVFSSHVIVPADSHFGEYRVNEDLFKADTYNQYLQKILTTITQRMERVTKDSRKYSSFPMLQINEAGIIGIIDSFIRTRLFNQPFNPFENYNWKILLANNGIATQHIVKQVSKAIIEMQNNVDISEAIVEKQYFSQVSSLPMREGKSLKVTKSIYERLSYPSNKGGLEKAFIEYLDSQAEVESFIKISENRHLFAQVFYEREDGLLAYYQPDFMAKTDKDIFIIETKGEDKKQDKNVKSKQIAMIDWCKRINSLPKEDRDLRQWHYILLTEKNFYTYRNGNVSFTNLCNLNKVSESNVKGELFN
jgi:type III restriction enzyme